jgi:predicted transposase/invertase (TIGR01784 family)
VIWVGNAVKTDTIFYQLFKEFPHIFFELIGKPNTNANIYEFTAPEIKQRGFRLDGVFSTLENFSTEPLYFVEIQFYKDEEFYDRLFTGIFLYFTQEQPGNQNWYAVVIYDRRSNECPVPYRYHALIEPHLRRIYLNEITQAANESLGVGIVHLVVEPENQAEKIARKLINKAMEELTDALIQEQVIEFIQTIFVYKFPNFSREEIETMLGLSQFRQTKVYQEAFEEGKLKNKLEMVSKLLKRGLSIQEIAEILELDIETVRKAAEEQS